MTYKRNVYKRCSNGVRECARKNAPCEEIRIKTETVTEIEPSLAAVYPIDQRWREILDGDEGLKRGTIFCELYKPFKGDKCKKGGCSK